jgi:lysyl-tRNA synthetase, class II
MGHFVLTQYQERIADTGRQELFLLLIGTIVSFLAIRLSVRMIRAQVRWWPGNVTPGGLHIHHMVFGLGLLIATGAGSFTLGGDSRPWRGILAFCFGVGVGLVLDEFALILHLEDVYWTKQGRKSVDAVILAIALFGLALVGEAPLGGISDTDPGWAIVVNAVLGSLFVIVSLLKGKLWTGLLGIMLPVIALVGAVRLGRPGSPWARWRYTTRPRRLARAQRREDRLHSRLARGRVRIFDAVAGAPTAHPRDADRAHEPGQDHGQDGEP